MRLHGQEVTEIQIHLKRDSRPFNEPISDSSYWSSNTNLIKVDNRLVVENHMIHRT